ncbi:hypothetical protein [Christensenella timonensis]|uniref:hypothetical protein n=1 Tax=Christensenella timonensis TaxID=1816678 RepID=UPI0011CA68D9|nr:hypothetical protein [Christensenella timonensis]
MGKEQHSERDARIRRQEEERARQKREAERRRKEEERRRKEEEERKRQEEEERKRRQQEAEERAKQAALEAAQSGWQPPQGEDKKASTQAAQFGWQPPQGDDKKASTQAAQFGWQPPQGDDKKASTEAAQFGWQPPQMQKQEGEKEGAPQAQGKPYARTLMDNVLAHEGDTGDPFLMELNRDSWEQEYREGRIKAFKEAVGQLAGQLMSGEVKPAEGTGKQGNWTDGDLSDPFLQGLFGEEELKNEFVQGQMEQFMPALERRIAQLRGKVSGQTEEEPQQKDTAYGTNMVYTMDKDGKTASTEAAQSGWQPPQGNDKTASTQAAQFGWQPPQGNDKTASTETAQFGWQPPQGNDKTASLEGAQSGWQPPQGNDKKASTQAAQFGWQPPQEPKNSNEIDWTQEYDAQPQAEPPQPPPPQPKPEGTISNEANNKTQYTDWEKLLNDPVSKILAPVISKIESTLQGALGKGVKPDGTPIYKYPDWTDEDIRTWYESAGSVNEKLEEISSQISGVKDNPDIEGIGEAVYLSEDDAAKAFAEIAKNKPDWDTNEYAAMMVTVKMPQTDPTGRMYVAERTLLLPVTEGGKSNVIMPVMEQYLKFAGVVTSEAGIPVTGVSFIHSHPAHGGGIVDEFSNGDRIVGMLPGVANMYRVNGDSGQIWRYNEWEEQMYGGDYWDINKTKDSGGYLYNKTYNGIKIN